MNLKFICLLILATAASTRADPQYWQRPYNGHQNYYNNPVVPNYFFRSGYPQPSFDGFEGWQQQDYISLTEQLRALFTVTFSTTTSTTTITSYSTCTTSTASLKKCSPSGRRRRGMILSGDRKGRGLFFNEKDHEEEGSFFLPLPKKIEEPIAEEKKIAPLEISTTPTSSMIEPGSETPNGARQARQIFAFITKTVTTSSTTTSTVQLTATCYCTTGFSGC